MPLEPTARSYGESWIVLDSAELADRWLGRTRSLPVPVTGSASLTVGDGPRRRPAIPAGLRFQVLRRDDFQCVYCGRRAPDVDLHVDHIVP